MPRYHFTSVLDDYDADPEGVILADADKARTRAIHFAGDLLMTYTAKVERTGRAQVDVTDAWGRPVCTVLTTVTDHACPPTGSGAAGPSAA